MYKATVPIRHRPLKSFSDPRFGFAMVLLTVFRGFIRCQEVFGSPRTRERARAFRIKMHAMNQDRDSMLRAIDDSHGRDTTELMDDFVRRHGDAETAAEWNETSSALHKLGQHSDALKRIVHDAGDDLSQAERRLREYTASNPDGELAYSYLGGVLTRAGDWDGSLSAYRETIRLAGAHSVSGANARLHIADVLQAKGDYEAASEQYRNLIEDRQLDTDGVVAIAYLGLGDALEAMQDPRNARTAWKQAIKWDPTNVIAPPARERLRARK